MDAEKKTELSVKVFTAVLTLATVIIGVWQFNKGQKEIKEREIVQRNFELTKMSKQASLDALAKFKEIQNQKYVEAAGVVSYLAVSEDFESAEYKARLKRFWQLYWVELSSVETAEVESAMVHFGDVLKALEESHFKNFKESKPALNATSYAVAQAIKKSAKTWALPDGLQ